VNKQEFIVLDTEKQVEFVNKHYKELRKTGEVAKLIGTSESWLLKYLLDKGFKPNKTTKAFEKVSEGGSEVFNKKQPNHNADLEDLLLYKDLLIMMAKEKLSGNDKQKIDFSILDDYEDSTKTRSYIINDEINEKFEKVCKQYKRFKKQDILSVALLEFINKYGENIE
jgi:hypothetical protein